MPNYYNPYYQPQNYYQTMMQTQPQAPQIQDGGFVPVPSEEVARNYPVAFGKSVTFKDENAPYIYTKTMGFSQLETPKFEKYKLVKEPIAEVTQPTQNGIYDDGSILNTIDRLNKEINSIWNEIEVIKNDNNSESTSERITKRDKDGND